MADLVIRSWRPAGSHRFAGGDRIRWWEKTLEARRAPKVPFAGIVAGVRATCAAASKPRLNDRFGLTNCHIRASPFMVVLFRLLKSCIFPPSVAYRNLETRGGPGGGDGGAAAEGSSSNGSSHYD